MRSFDRNRMRPPEILSSPQAQERRAEIQAYVAQIQTRGEQLRPPDWIGLLEDPAVSRQVARQFDEVCAYCERRTPPEKGSLHHHRPPALAAQEDGGTQLLHYVWLTYDWENLLWVCRICARRKENRFYAGEPTQTIGASVQELRASEDESFLDPSFHAPHEHLGFWPDGSVWSLDEKGEATIELLGLNRSDLAEGRRAAGLVLAERLQTQDGLHAAQRRSEGGASGWLLHPQETPGAAPGPFFGAASLALLAWARWRGRKVADCQELLALPLDDRRRLARDYGREVGRIGPRPTPADPYGGDFNWSRAAKLAPAEPEAWDRSFRIDGREARSLPRPDAPRPRDRPFRPAQRPLAEARISRVAIRNFKALKNVELLLPAAVEDSRLVPCAAILGENATGKSSALEAVALALLGVEEIGRLREALPEEDLSPAGMRHRPDPLDWDKVDEAPLEIEISYHDYPETTRLSATQGGAGEDLAYGGSKNPSKLLLAYGSRRYFSNAQQDLSLRPHDKARSLFRPLVALPDPVDWLLNCDDDRIFDAAVRALREVLTLSEEAGLRRDAPNRRIMIDVEGGTTPLTRLSEGYRSVVALTVTIIRELMAFYDNLENAHAVVLIDEIEVHLHPRWKMRIVERLRRAFPRVQFLVTTHDPLCLRGMFRGEVFVLHRDPENRRVESLKNLPDVRGMRAEQLLTSEFFGLGSTDPETDARLARYEALSRKADPTPDEKRERSRLRAGLRRSMKVGDSLQEQILNQMADKLETESLAALPKIRETSRRAFVEDLIAKIKTIEQGFGSAAKRGEEDKR